MARKGGPSTLAGIDYQLLYTASRLAEAITQEGITSLRPEAHQLEPRPDLPDGLSALTPEAPTIDDLTLTHRDAPNEYVSLKHQAGQAYWNAAQLIGRGVLDDFFRQHQLDPTARLRLVSQSPADPDLRDCAERAGGLTPSHPDGLESGPRAAYDKLATYLRAHYPAADTGNAALLKFLAQVEFAHPPAELLTENMELRLRPHLADAPAAARVLYAYALRAGKQQLRLTPATIRQELTQQGYPLVQPPAPAQVWTQLARVGAGLAAVPATIGQRPDYHLVREEVAELVDWVLTPLPTDTTAATRTARSSRLVTGGAGTGKTVVLRDLYRALQERQVPVLALKADLIKGATRGALLADIRANGLDLPVEQALAVVATPECPAVVLIDQLDALSLYLGAERGMLTSYTLLLHELQQHLPHVRFVFSCRTFDLKHDPELAPFRAATRVTVRELTDEQLAHTLQATGAGSLANLAPAVIELLRVPLHLAIYCALDPETRQAAPATSLQGLYDQLLHDYLLHPRRLPPALAAGRVTQLLYGLATAMYERQQLTLPRLIWEERDAEACRYLQTQGILRLTDPRQQLAFFHQTFYEYLFARQFVAREQALAAFVLTSGQGLYLRSLVQQVLVFQRGNDFAAYLRDLHALLAAPDCRFHLKLLLLQYLASQPDPDPAELALARAAVMPHPVLAQPFCEAVSALPWLVLLAEPVVFMLLTGKLADLPTNADSSLPSTVIGVLAQHAPELLLPQLARVPAGPHRADWLLQALDAAGATTAAGFTDLFEQETIQEVPSARQRLLSWQILLNQAPVRPTWVAGQVFAHLAPAPFTKDQPGQRPEYLEAEVLKRLWETDPQLTFTLCARLLRTWVRRGNNYRHPELAAGFWGETYYTLFPAPIFLDHLDLADRHQEPHAPAEAVLYYLWQYSEDPAHTVGADQQRLLRKWLFSRTDLLVTLALAAAVTYPAAFAAPLLRLFLKPDWLAGVSYQAHLGYYTRRLLPTVWDFASAAQRQQLQAALTSPRLVAHSHLYTDQPTGKRRYDSSYGHAALAYLQALGEERLREFPPLAAMRQEFTRRWGPPAAEREPEATVQVRWGGEASPARQWPVARVSPANWLRALRKYRAKVRPGFGSDEGTYQGLCTQLGELLRASPVEWVGLLRYLLEQGDESATLLLPELCAVDAGKAAPLVELAYERHLLGEEDYRRLRRKVAPRPADPKQPLAEELVRIDLAVIRANLTAESPMRPNLTNAQRDLLTLAINTPGARELDALLREKIPASQVAPLVEVLRQVAATGGRPQRAAAVGHLAMLLRTTLPPDTIIDLFQQVVGTDYALLAAGQWSLQYLIWRDTPAVLRLLAAGRSEPLAHETITRLLTVQWGHDTPGALELLESLWAINPTLRVITLQQLRTGRGAWTRPAVLLDALTLCLAGDVDQELANGLDSFLRELPADEFPAFQPLLSRYISSAAAYLDHKQGLLTYLSLCVRQYPVGCVELLQQLLQEAISSPRGVVLRNHFLEVLLEAYARLPHQQVQDAAVQQALNVFDTLLLQPIARRTNLQDALREVAGS